MFPPLLLSEEWHVSLHGSVGLVQPPLTPSHALWGQDGKIKQIHNPVDPSIASGFQTMQPLLSRCVSADIAGSQPLPLDSRRFHYSPRLLFELFSPVKHSGKSYLLAYLPPWWLYEKGSRIRCLMSSERSRRFNMSFCHHNSLSAPPDHHLSTSRGWDGTPRLWQQHPLPQQPPQPGWRRSCSPGHVWKPGCWGRAGGLDRGGRGSLSPPELSQRCPQFCAAGGAGAAGRSGGGSDVSSSALISCSNYCTVSGYVNSFKPWVPFVHCRSRGLSESFWSWCASLCKYCRLWS